MISTLRLTSAQLHIKSPDAQELAINLWNTQTDVCLISALLNTEVYWSLQCGNSADLFNGSSFVNVVLPHRLFLPRDIIEISSDKCSYIESISDDALALMENTSFYSAINALWSYKQSLRSFVQMAILWAGIESLFHIKNELRFRLSLLASKFLDEGLEKYKEVKKLYDHRSKAVHKGPVADSKVVKATAALLHQLILKMR